MRSRAWTKGLGAALFAASVSGCGLFGVDDPPREVTVPNYQVLHAGEVKLVMQTEHLTVPIIGTGAQGRLRIVGDGCVGYRVARQPVLLVFPPDTTVTGSGADDVVVHSLGEDLHIGDQFYAGGSLEPAHPADALAAAIPGACARLKVMGLTDQ